MFLHLSVSHSVHSGEVYPSVHWAVVCVSQHALERGLYPSMHWAGGYVSQHALGGCVYPSMHWVGGVPMGCVPRCVCPGCVAGGCLPRGVYTPRSRGRHPPWTRGAPRRPLQRMVRILLKRILVYYFLILESGSYFPVTQHFFTR